MGGRTARARALTEVAERAADWPELFELSLDEFLDEFYEAPHQHRQAMLKDEPPPISPFENAYLAAAAEYLARLYGLHAPEWVRADERFLTSPCFTPPNANPQLRALLLMDSPVEFRRRYIFTEREPLRRKLGPIKVSPSAPARA